MKLLIWDFDGVILLSDSVRVKGFEYIFRNHNASHIKALINFHNLNGGLSRYVKIRYFYENILNKSISEIEVNQLAEEFSIVMKKELINTELLNQEWLDLMDNIDDKYEHHIASGSDGKELRFLCEELGISKHFESINGSPVAKVDLVAAIIENSEHNKLEICLIGDAINDWDAAKMNGIDFFGYRNDLLLHRGRYLMDLRNLRKLL